jgi:hypothetical protein
VLVAAQVMDKLPHYCPVCAYLEWNLDGLVEMIWEYLDLLRVYTKPKVGGGLCRRHQDCARLTTATTTTTCYSTVLCRVDRVGQERQLRELSLCARLGRSCCRCCSFCTCVFHLGRVHRPSLPAALTASLVYRQARCCLCVM